MPVYEYSCPKCGNEIEIIQHIGEKAPLCECCGEIMKKTISLSNFFLIGTGWSNDGYEHSKTKKAKKGK